MLHLNTFPPSIHGHDNASSAFSEKLKTSLTTSLDTRQLCPKTLHNFYLCDLFTWKPWRTFRAINLSSSDVLHFRLEQFFAVLFTIRRLPAAWQRLIPLILRSKAIESAAEYSNDQLRTLSMSFANEFVFAKLFSTLLVNSRSTRRLMRVKLI